MRSLIVNQNPNKVSAQFAELDNIVNQSPWQSQRVHEVSLEQQHHEIEQLAPTLANLSHQGRWIVLVGAPKQVVNALNEMPTLDSARILLVHPDDQTDSLWAIEQALMSGNSSAVLGWPGVLNSRDRKRLQLASKRTSALAFVFNEQRQVSPVLSLPYENQATNQLNHRHYFH